jgi:aspartyl-tRNA(Asn)/glutamyl-tRNA(Gln) amidotransferase subunit A
MTAELCDLPAANLVNRLKRGEINAMEILESTLARISSVEGRNPTIEEREPSQEDRKKIHAFISVLEAQARERALEIDRMLALGEDPGPLAGVPVAIKDIFCMSGTQSTAGSKILANFISPYTATPVNRLQQAGAVIVGKNNLDEFTYGSSNESTAFRPPPGNPWDPSRVPGGSSGGSAAAVAAGECVLALGTDTSGSIRQPAAFCGVVGLKPTYGRVSRYGLIAFASSLDCPGPLAQDVTDAALMLRVISGEDARDATAASLKVPDYLESIEDGVAGMRIGISPDTFQVKYPDQDAGDIVDKSIDDEIKQAVLHAADRLAAAGAEIIENIPLPTIQYAIPAYFVISRVEAASNLHRYDGVKYGFRYDGDVQDLHELYRKSRNLGFGLQPKLRILMGMYVSGEQYEKKFYERALRVRSLIRRDFETAFDPDGPYRLDCLLSATTPSTAFEMGAIYGDSVMMQYTDLLTAPASHAGVPALSIPGGVDTGGMPIGIQITGPDFTEGRLLRTGRAYELATKDEPWRGLRPKVLADV